MLPPHSGICVYSSFKLCRIYAFRQRPSWLVSRSKLIRYFLTVLYQNSLNGSYQTHNLILMLNSAQRTPKCILNPHSAFQRHYMSEHVRPSCCAGKQTFFVCLKTKEILNTDKISRSVGTSSSQAMDAKEHCKHCTVTSVTGCQVTARVGQWHKQKWETIEGIYSMLIRLRARKWRITAVNWVQGSTAHSPSSRVRVTQPEQMRKDTSIKDRL